MNKIAKRFVAGVSAAALFVSAIGSDAFTSLFPKTVSAEGTTLRNGKSTGFSSLEQDTTSDNEYYNTGYGLHTNKTATALEDGRTFDVNLESWYVGENPVDVATILDASGSMAWTVDTLDPMKVSEQLTDDERKTLESKYGTDILTEIQETNGGYLPQDVVDLILDPTKTDNTKLEYDGYKYYVYEGRSTVSEFVPLGYWDGGTDPKTDPALIGYYPFSGDLKNKAPNAEKDATGILINHPEKDGTYNPEEQATFVPKAVFDTAVEKGKALNRGLNIAKTAALGGILIERPTTSKFSVKMDITVDNTDKNYQDATFLYITDGNISYEFVRAGGTSPNRMKIFAYNAANKKITVVNANNIFDTTKKITWTFTFDQNNGTLTLETNKDTSSNSIEPDKRIQWVGSEVSTENSHTYDLTTGYDKFDMANLKLLLVVLRIK